MIDSDDLYRLIQSLSKSEKRYFKQSCKVHKIDNNYLNLFDYLVVQPTYDIKDLKRYFRNSTISKFYPAIKKYLWDAIIKSLRSYHQDKFINIKIRTLLDHAEILLFKGFHKKAAKMVKAAKAIAHSYEKHALILATLDVEREVAGASFEWGATSNELIYQEAKTLAQEIVDKTELSVLGASIGKLLTSSSKDSVSAEQLKHFKLIINDKIVQKCLNSKYTTVRSSAQQMSINYFNYVNKQKQVYQLTLNNYNLLNNSPKVTEENPSHLLNCLYILCLLYINVSDKKKFLIYKNKLKTQSLKIDNPKLVNLKIASLDRVSALEFEFYLQNKDFETAQKIINDTQILIANSKNFISMERRTVRLYQISFTQYALGDFKNAVNNLNEIINNYKKSRRKDQYIAAYILFALCMIEICKIEKSDNYFLKNHLVNFKLYLRNHRFTNTDEYKISNFLLWYIKEDFNISDSIADRKIVEKYKKLNLTSSYLFFNDWLLKLRVV